MNDTKRNPPTWVVNSHPEYQDERSQRMMREWNDRLQQEFQSRLMAARAKDAEEIAKWKGIVKGVHGALADLGDIPVPSLDADLYDTVMSIRAKDAELIQMLVNDLSRAYCIDKPSLKLAADMGFNPSDQ